MRRVVTALLFASTLASCNKSEKKPAEIDETRSEAIAPEPRALPTPPPPRPVETSRPTPPVNSEPVPVSPFLVQPTPPAQATNPDALEPLPPPTFATPPPPQPQPWATTTNTTGKPCPRGKCLLRGRCVRPGGPIASEDDPPDAVPGVCGGDGGPCSFCRCVSPETALSTPEGEIPIADLRTNDLVYSIHQGRIQAVRILATQRVRVKDHSMARIELHDRFVMEISGDHPLGDGRSLWELIPGEKFGDARIEALSVVPYEGTFTYDVLPDSDTGTYFVHGLWVGSTMFGQSVRGDVSN